VKRTLFLSTAVLASTLFGASIAPGCGTPGEEADDAASGGEDAYTMQGTCDGLPRLANLKTPPGVCVGLVANGFTFARGIAETPSGDLVLAEMGGWAQDRGGVWLLRRKADRTFAKVRLMKLIDKPSGVAIGPDGLVYVGDPKNVFRIDPYETVPRTGPLPAEVRQPRLEIVVKDLPGDGRHPLKKFVFDKRDPWTLYVNVGSASDVCEQGAGARPPSGFPMPCVEGDTRGVIRKYVLDGPNHTATSFTTMAKGLRNSMALAVHPSSGALVQGENSRDSINKQDASLTDQEGDLPHEELNVITPGAHYGWPYCFDNGTPNPEYRGRVDCARYTNPALLLPGHVSPLGMTYYTGDLFPAAYKNNLVVTFHGYREYGHRLVLVPVDANGIPGGGEPLDIIRGWEKSADGRDPMGAPVDVIQSKDGALYVTEDKNGDVLRVFYDRTQGDGAPMRPLPPQRPVQSADERARCDDLARRSDAFSRVQKDVIDVACVSCHGAGPGYAGGLALLKCDAVGNAKRLVTARSGGRGAYVEPRNEQSELVKRLKGDGYPQMPAGGVSPEQLDEVLAWIRAGAPVPR
jgi:glucose/arabinose dehydrogenase